RVYDGQKDLRRGFASLLPERDNVSADVEPADITDNLKHVGACRVWSAHFGGRGEGTGGGISFQRKEVRLEIRIERFLGGLIIGDNLCRRIPRKRDDLGHDNALTLGTELF